MLTPLTTAANQPIRPRPRKAPTVAPRFVQTTNASMKRPPKMFRQISSGKQRNVDQAREVAGGAPRHRRARDERNPEALVVRVARRHRRAGDRDAEATEQLVARRPQANRPARREPLDAAARLEPPQERGAQPSGEVRTALAPVEAGERRRALRPRQGGDVDVDGAEHLLPAPRSARSSARPAAPPPHARDPRRRRRRGLRRGGRSRCAPRASPRSARSREDRSGRGAARASRGSPAPAAISSLAIR